MPRGMWDLSYQSRDQTRARLQWKHRVLITGLPGNCQLKFFSSSKSKVNFKDFGTEIWQLVSPFKAYLLSHISHVWLFATPWTVATRLYPWNFPGKNTGVGCHFPTQGLNPWLMHWQVDYHWAIWEAHLRHKCIKIDIPRRQENNLCPIKFGKHLNNLQVALEYMGSNCMSLFIHDFFFSKYTEQYYTIWGWLSLLIWNCRYGGPTVKLYGGLWMWGGPAPQPPCCSRVNCTVDFSEPWIC